MSEHSALPRQTTEASSQKRSENLTEVCAMSKNLPLVHILGAIRTTEDMVAAEVAVRRKFQRNTSEIRSAGCAAARRSMVRLPRSEA